MNDDLTPDEADYVRNWKDRINPGRLLSYNECKRTGGHIWETGKLEWNHWRWPLWIRRWDRCQGCGISRLRPR